MTTFPADPRLADAAHHWKSAYVHIPFCRRRCPYCDFAIIDESAGAAIPHDAYVDAVRAEIAMEGPFGPLDAVNFGGGTPSLVEPAKLGAIISDLGRRFGFVEGVEVSLELNPEDWSEDLGRGLVEAGFTRVSLGAQSFDQQVLGALGRVHEVRDVEHAVRGARDVGFRSIGVDVIIGHPSESDASWEATLDVALGLGVDHLSSYTLTVEPGTELSKRVLAGEPAPDDDTQAERYGRLLDRATAVGIERYEVSNHATAGHACRYNLATWAHAEYLGFGLGAHDHRWGDRARNHRRMDRYLDAISRGERPRLGTETLSTAEQERDRLMLGLRLAAGTPLTPTAARFAASDAGQRFLEADVMEVRGDRLVVTVPMLTDAIAREALSVAGSDC